ncbi:hypothetical protein F0562_026705 [Nyssa sinensis]|uniref:DYW domain-containing protein n=1 Tax=Nyssa sinensis TaxID=561372 RepID=A0A5J5BA41_9ASTE|nr:hypothetical protein F0562_026705 [Nyssa sinensis]
MFKMIMKFPFWGTWKRHRWKNFFTFYSTIQHNRLNHHHPDIVATNIAITQHAKHGQLDIARDMFDKMSERTVVSWNTMISGYSKWGRFNEALNLVSAMHLTNTKLNETTFSSVLSVCAHSCSLWDGKQVHGLVLKSGSESFKLVGSALLYFYSSCFEIEDARRVFDVLHERNELLWNLMLVGYVQCNLTDDALDVFNKMPTRDVIAWTTLISSYSKSQDGCEKALELFWLMRESGEAAPNEFTLDCVLRACGGLGALHEGRVVHGLLIRCGLEFEYSIGGALIDFYCNCRAMDDAERVYDRQVNPCLNYSNTLMAGLISMGRFDDAELIFDGLIEKNKDSYNLMIKGNGEIDKALELFEETKWERNPVTWNSMISGLIHSAQHEEAIRLYVTMRKLSIGQTRSTFSALFHACSCLGSLQQGQQLHAHLIKTPFESNVFVGTALVDMYSKCGSISDAQTSFINVSNPNVAAWTALINGYAHHGLGSEALLLLEHMLEQGVDPNAPTFVVVLSACVHAGLVNEGMRIFRLMEKHYGVTPNSKHYACVVDLLGRAGYIREAEELVKEMPIEADNATWGALLNACWFWMDKEVSERVAEKMINLNPKPISAYVIMSNIYAGLGRWGEKMKVRKILWGLEVKKDPGCSWIELNKEVHVFSVDDRTHPYCNVIYATLEHLNANVNSSAQYDYVSIPITLNS